MRKGFFTLLLLAALLMQGALPHAAGSADPAPLAYVLKVDGIISPATDELIKRHLKIATMEGAAVVVLEMHTPGGLYDSMQRIIQTIIDSPVPVATYVSPAGSHAASAGTYILYASHIAAMAPGTNIGAATPINLAGGGRPSAPGDKKPEMSTLEHKMVNDAAAYIRTLGELRNRNLDWAAKAVREAETLTASEALSKKVIDVVAADVPDLMNRIDGKTVKMGHDKTMTLHTKGARITHSGADWRTRILEVIADPNIAMLLMSVGTAGLIYEVTHPGAVLPGVVGAICLLLALYAMNVLPVSAAGAALVLLGLALMAAEAFMPAFGALGIGGAAAFAAGGLMLIDSDVPGFGVDPWLIGVLTLTMLGLLSAVLSLALKAQRRKPVTGHEAMISSIGEVLSWAHGQGEVRVAGEVWRAETPKYIMQDGQKTEAPQYILQKGDKVRIVKLSGMTLGVVPEKTSKGE
jgi:membrane-bound serine protease (ClpP class)